MPARESPKSKEIRFSHYDLDDKVLVESVWHEGKVKYLLFHIPTKEYGLQDKYVIRKYNRTIHPPPIDHEYLIKAQPVIVPKFNGTIDVEGFDQDALDKDLKEFIKEYLLIPEEYLVVLSSFAKFTWVHERSDIKPYISVWGDKGTGKSSVVETAMQWVCRYSNYAAGGVTTSSLLRHVDLINGTEMLDEADWLQSEEGDKIRAVLRGGYKSSGTYMLSENTGRTFYPKLFNTGCPKILLGRQPIGDDALRSRCLELPLKPIDVPVEKRRHTELWFEEARRARGQALVNRLLAYRFKELPHRYEKAPELFGYEARLSDTSQPLYYCLHNNEDRKLYLGFVNKNVTELLAERAEGMEGKLLLLIREAIMNSPARLAGPDTLLADDLKISLPEIISIYKERFEPETDEREFKKHVNVYKVGRRLAGLGIKSRRGTGGARSIDPASFALLPELYKRYGLPVADPAIMEELAYKQATEQGKSLAQTQAELSLHAIENEPDDMEKEVVAQM